MLTIACLLNVLVVQHVWMVSIDIVAHVKKGLPGISVKVVRKMKIPYYLTRYFKKMRLTLESNRFCYLIKE